MRAGLAHLRMILLGVAVLLGWTGLGVQCALMLHTAPAYGLDVVGVLIRLLSYFTILVNLAATILLSVTLMGRSPSPRIMAGVASYIVVVGIIYSLLLRHVWSPEGAQKFADIVLHDLMPVLYALFWLFFVVKNQLRWRDALVWLIFPLLYMIYAVLQGLRTGWYPYYFIDIGKLGMGQVLLNGAGLLVFFLAVGAGLIAIATTLRKRRAA